MRSAAELREGFLSYFEEKGHLRCPSASLVPRADDRSTLLTSAGMQPQMPYFLGREQPPAPLTTTSQKCFRTVDLDVVGLDTYHLTFFEMLGNFSFGQYFKDGAVEFAWEFVTERMRLDMDRFWVTVHAGDPAFGLGVDEVAVRAWERVGQPAEKIVPLPSSENFWSVGGPGPCGPDSEMYYDRGEEHGCGRPDCKPGCECERFLEFWNLVFMEYELGADGKLTPLPKQNIDTGMGLERASTIMQGVVSCYDIDAYQLIMQWLEAESGISYADAPKAHRVLADHGRGMTFLVGDGVTPSNEGRGYVLRRVIRRAIQQASSIGLEAPFVTRLADVVIEQMRDAYPELVEHRREIHAVLTAEEERFSQTLARGMRLFEEVTAGREEISGEDAFRLHDTYGFPLELTRELAEERGLGVNEEEFTTLMAEQRERSRAGRSDGEVRAAEFARDAGFVTDFVGYEKTDVLTAVGASAPLDGALQLVKLYESPFYPAGGGQVTDSGYVLVDGESVEIPVHDVVRVGDDQVVILDLQEHPPLEPQTRVRAVVNWSTRAPTMANHTATHLLHQALRDVLGEHVKQAGSAVRPDKLRFDFTHAQPLTPEQREEVERRVNEKVFANLPVRAYVTPIEEARKLGAMMLFGEKYGDEVRVIEIDEYSRELCGGTHVRATAEIGPFVILSESSVGSGARRIEALTAGEAWSYLRERAHEADALRAELERVRKEKPKERAAAARELPAAEVQVVNGVNVIVQKVEGVDADDLLELSDRFKQQHAPAAVVLAAREDGRVHLVVNLDGTLPERGLNAGDLIKPVAAVVGGGGGGRPTMARAGGRDPEKLDEAIATAQKLIASALS